MNKSGQGYAFGRRRASSSGYCKIYAIFIGTAFAFLTGMVYFLGPFPGSSSHATKGRRMRGAGETGSIEGSPEISEPITSEFIEEKSEDTKSSRHPGDSLDLRSTLRDLFDLGVRDPRALINKLEKEDPFGTEVGPEKFQCPSADEKHRIDYPNIMDMKNLENFREGIEGSFIFYQHLRKAGGTGFCDLAQNNLPKGTVPSYYCMPDNRGSLAIHPWGDTTYLSDFMRIHNFKMAANEWDVFHEEQAAIPNVVLATTIRHPIDRWYSQYRFEHLEHRDGSEGNAPRWTLIQFYNNDKGWTMGTNYYVKTFIGDKDPPKPQAMGDFYWTYHKYQKKAITWDMFQRSLNNFRRFHIILVTEWLDSSPELIKDALGWAIPPKQVLPHEVQAVRENKKSVRAADVTPAEDYDFMMEENVLDLLFFAAAKRIYLERLSCMRESQASKHS